MKNSGQLKYSPRETQVRSSQMDAPYEDSNERIPVTLEGSENPRMATETWLYRTLWTRNLQHHRERKKPPQISIL